MLAHFPFAAAVMWATAVPSGPSAALFADFADAPTAPPMSGIFVLTRHSLPSGKIVYGFVQRACLTTLRIEL